METGNYKAKILKNDIRQAGTGTGFVYLLLDVDGEKIAAQIWLTKKNRGQAIGQLRKCGFDHASESLSVLKDNPQHLEGNEVEIEVQEDEWKNDKRLKAQIVTTTVTKKRIEQIDGFLRTEEEDQESDIPF